MKAYRNHYGDQCWAGYGIWMRLVFLADLSYELQANVDGVWEHYRFPSYAKAHCFLVGLVD